MVIRNIGVVYPIKRMTYTTFVIIGVLWSLVMVFLYLNSLREHYLDALAVAKLAAIESFRKDLVYRKWASLHGGVYVPLSDRAHPNPHLADVPNRDLNTDNGLKLTLINPSYMTRQVHELGEQEYGLQGHITSLDPIRPGNSPDPWERDTLHKFKDGLKEHWAISDIDGQKYFRYMAPLMVEESCMKCHSTQGHRIGDLRGGISVSLPWDKFADTFAGHSDTNALTYGCIWFLGMLGLGISHWVISGQVSDQQSILEDLRKSQQKFELVSGAIQDVFWLFDLRTRKIEFISKAYETIWGQKPDAIYKNPGEFYSIVHPDDLELFKKTMSESQAKGTEFCIEFRTLRPDGSIRWVLNRGYPIQGLDGKLEYVCGTCSDITARKLVEDELRRFKTMSDGSVSGQGIADLDGKLYYVNEALARMHGYEVGECLGAQINIFHTEEQIKSIDSIREILIEKGRMELTETWQMRKDGTVFPSLLNGSIINDDHGVPAYIAVTVIDITELDRARQSLMDSETLFRTVFRTSPDSISIRRVDNGTYVDVNDSFLKSTGYSRQEVLGKTSIELGLWAEPEKRHEYIDRLKKDAQLTNYEIHFMTKDGRSIAGLLSSAIFELHGVPHALTVVRDIDDLKKNQAEYARLATAVDQAAERVLITDVEGRIVYVNPAFEVSTGYTREEAIGQHPSILNSGQHDQAFYDEMWKTVSTGNVWTGHIINRKKDGSLIHERAAISPVRDATGQIVNYVQMATDITVEENLRNQLSQSQKMEAIGALAGGIAHDFNNIIQAITGYTELVMDDLPVDSRAYTNLSKVRDAAGRSKEMVKQILTFSRRSEPNITTLEMSPLVKEGLKFLKAAIPPTIEIDGVIGVNPGMIIGDPTQIHQVLMNLCVNAAQSMPLKKGTVFVKLDQVVLDAAFTNNHTHLAPGKHVRLRVSDNGSGISPEILDKIFDPYFTTKEKGEGTGMGLSVVHAIVESCRGAITVDSRLGIGTEFTVYFPVVEESDTCLVEIDKTPSIPRGTERVLVVDDEIVLVDMYERQLRRLGYTVIKSTSPVEAVKMVLENPQQFDVIITDLMMPEMSGLELVEKLSFLRPAIPIIICSGWNERLTEDQIETGGIRTVVSKPAMKNELAAAIREVMDGSL